MEEGERIQYTCGHWLVAGQFGLQDAYAREATAGSCGECERRLRDAAPALLEALEKLTKLGTVWEGPQEGAIIVGPQGWEQAQAAIAKAKNQAGQGIRPASD
jgi:hypothetical protein